ncbi:oligosaccharide flippase family protein [Mesorhizobium sp. SB112]|uniref:oligosaccharide flippase family protein n=1 Tax=Mesorhizobium sp. SB112 TaxID=3151853 RepID=UPI0032646FAD
MKIVRLAFIMAALEQYLGLVIGFAVIAVLSRLLTPAEIGISAIATSITMIVFSVREFATPEFLIQRREVSRDDLRTASTILMGLIIILSLLLFVASGWLENFYGAVELKAFLLLSILSAISDAFSLPIFTMMRRDMAFGTITRIKTIGSLITAIAVIGFAWHGYSYLSIAIGGLIGSLATTILALIARPSYLVFKPSIASWRHLVDFGRYKGATYITDRIYEALPQLVLGRVMPMASVGIFNRANAVCGIPDRLLMSSIFTVAFPALAAAAREGSNIKETYLRSLGYIAVIYWPGVILMAILAEPAVRIVLGPGWEEAILLVQLIALSSVFWFPIILTYPLLMALGENRDAFVSNFIGRIVAAVILCAASFHSLTAIALSQFISMPFQMMMSFRYVRRHVPFTSRQIFSAISGSMIVTFISMLGPTIYVLARGFGGHLTVLDAAICMILAAVGWFGGLIIVKHPFLEEIRGVTDMVNWRGLLMRKTSAPRGTQTARP